MPRQWRITLGCGHEMIHTGETEPDRNGNAWCDVDQQTSTIRDVNEV